jgi:tryptophanyl-tRNA synthetase
VLAGLLNYPVLQAADVLLYMGEVVPVGEDQVQHIELMREIARRWNSKFGPGFFPEPQAAITEARRIIGLDGQAKMSKSIGNTVGILEQHEDIWQRLRPAVTDPARVKRTDPGDPSKCNVFSLHQYFSSDETLTQVSDQCRSAGWGCLDCKRVLADGVAAAFAPIREHAEELTSEPSRVLEILQAGAAKARSVAEETMRGVRDRMGLMSAAGPSAR